MSPSSPAAIPLTSQAPLWCAPVQRVHIPQHREHVQVLFQTLIPASVRRPDIGHILPGDSFQDLVSLHKLFPKYLFIIRSQLDMTVGMIADQMSIRLLPPDRSGQDSAFSPVTKNVATTPRSFSPSSSRSVYRGLGPSSKAQCCLFRLHKSSTDRQHLLFLPQSYPPCHQTDYDQCSTPSPHMPFSRSCIIPSYVRVH